MNPKESINNILKSIRIDNYSLETLEIEQHVKENELGRIDKEISENQLQLINIEEEFKKLNNAKKLLESLKNYKLQEKKDFILTIINKALVDIFQDNIYLDIIPQEKKTSTGTSQKYDIVFYQNDIEMARNEELLKSNGGGIMQVVSMLFKLLIGYIYSENKFYMFDESFSQLSGSNRSRLSKFLREFCETYGFTLVVVSQTTDLNEFAHFKYHVSKVNDNDLPKLVLDKIESDVNPEEYFDINISNFQSIVNLNLKLYGFTIIAGPNNSGKSAIIRAITSILYNNFDSKKYPRIKINPKTKKVGQLPTKITLSKVSNDIKTISLHYKSKKLFFEIDGEEYYGKNLAADKIRDAVQELGFKYINTKEFYKNFKGSLKDQTERLASTNQYDSLFLIGGKSNETEKIFNFLFNTELISLAIVKIREDIQELDKIFKNIDENILYNLSKKSNIEKIIIILNTVINYIKINEFIESKKILNKNNIIKDNLNKKINFIDAIIPRLQHIKYIPEVLNNLINEKTELLNKKTILNNYKNNISIIENIEINLNKLLEKKKYFRFLHESLTFISGSTTRLSNLRIESEVLSKKLNIINILIDKLLKLSEFKNLVTILNTFDKTLYKKLEEKKIELDNLIKSFDIHVCPSCNGLGYIIKN